MARPQRITDETILEALAAAGEATSAALAARLGIGTSTAARRLVALESAGSATRLRGGRVHGVRVSDRWSAVAVPEARPRTRTTRPASGPPRAERVGVAEEAVAEPTSEVPPASGGRLGRGALGALVRGYLAARPAESLGPTQIGKALGRSQGAVANALERLEAAGDAQLVSASPRRYRTTATRT